MEKKRKRKNKNRLYTNTNAGNVEYNIAFFNSMNGTDGISGIGASDGTVGNVAMSGGMGESINDQEKRRDNMEKWAIIMSSGGGTERVFMQCDNEEEARDMADLYDYHFEDENGFDWSLSVEEISNTKFDEALEDSAVEGKSLVFKYAENGARAIDDDWKIESVFRSETHGDGAEQTARSIVVATNGDEKAYFITDGYTNKVVTGPFKNLKDASGEFVHQWDEEREYEEPEQEYASDYNDEGQERTGFNEALDIDDFADENVKYDIFGDVIPSSDAPETPEDNGVASIINALIVDEYEAVKGYNDAIVNVREMGREDMIPVLQDIVAEENKHIGQLQEIMKMVASNAVEINNGAEEAKKQLQAVAMADAQKIVAPMEQPKAGNDPFDDAMYFDGDAGVDSF